MFWRRQHKPFNEIMRENLIIVIPLCGLVYGYGQLSQQVSTLEKSIMRLEAIALERSL